MNHNYAVSQAIAWQSYDCIDTLIIMDHKSDNFFLFHNTGRTIFDSLLNGCSSFEEIKKELLDQYDIDEECLTDQINDFLGQLLQEELIYEC